MDRFVAPEPFVKAAITVMDDVLEGGVELEAVVRSLVNQFQRLVQTSSSISNDLGEMVLSAGAGDPSLLSDLAASVLNIAVEEKIGLLERNSIKDRVQKLFEIVTREEELQEISSRIQSQVADEVGKTQRQVLPPRADEGDPEGARRGGREDRRDRGVEEEVRRGRDGRELIKVVKHEGENAKVAVRNVRRDANAHLKQLLKDKQVAEDEERRAQDDIQKLTDRYIAEVDKAVQQKEADLMAI